MVTMEFTPVRAKTTLIPQGAEKLLVEYVALWYFRVISIKKSIEKMRSGPENHHK